MPPWAGLHNDGDGAVELAQLRQHGEAVDLGHDQVEDDEREDGVGSGQARQRFLAAGGDGRAIAEALNRSAEQPALDRVVVDDEDGG